MTEAKKGPIKWSALLLYVLVIPAALQLLSRLDAYFEFSGLIGRLLRAWDAFIHGLWEWLFALLPQWVELSDNQTDALTWCAAMVGAAVFAPDEDAPERRASQPQAAVLFWLGFATAAAIFFAPYVPALVRAVELEFERVGAGGVRQSFLINLGLFALAGVYLVSVVLDYRKRHADRTLVPLWMHLEQILGGFLVAGATGWMLGIAELESVEAAERGAAAFTGVNLEFIWTRFLVPLMFTAAFVFTVVNVRRENWASMPRMIAAAGGVFIADRLIVLADPYVSAWLAS